MFITAPLTLIQTMLTLFAKYKSKSSIDNDKSPAGREYSIAEKLPANKLPSKTFTVSVISEYFQPSKTAVISIKMFDIPILAPGRTKGGNKLSITKDKVARADKIAQRVNL